MNRRNPTRGFTLIELMVTVAIIAIASAIAIPSYQQYTRESRRASAYAALTDAVSRQEQFFLDNKTYTATVSGGGLNMAATTEGGYYALSVDAPGAGCPIASCYVLRAAPQLSQVADTCGELTISSMGQKLPQGCW